MARVVVLGAGISGHTAALHLRRLLRRPHEVVVVSPNSKWNWIPSNIWVGVGKMNEEEVTFPLAPIYRRKGIEFHQALATEIHFEGDEEGESRPHVVVRYTNPAREGEVADIAYDYLINATGPRLNFAATPGLGPQANSLSVCTPAHARDAATALAGVIEKLRSGQRQRLVVGVGHGGCTCEGAAFEYCFNVEHELRTAGVRDLADLVYLTNEYELGDFGVGGMSFVQNGFETTSKMWTESLFRERAVSAITRAHVERVDEGQLTYLRLDGTRDTLDFDFAMLLPPFRGAELTVRTRTGEDISTEVFAPNGFMRVDADYSTKPFEEWTAADWPSTYESVRLPRVFAVGIAFAPPHAISQPRSAPDGTVISPAPPRTGMPSGVMGKAAALTIRDRVLHGDQAPAHTASMARMGAACVASAGTGLRKGTAAAMTMYPVVPDFTSYPETGRSIKDTFGEIGLAGHWIKYMLHVLFLYKAKARPLWHLIPE